MSRWHPQDYLLIAEALAQFAGAEAASPREERAWILTEEIAHQQGVSVEEIPHQIDEEWSG